LDRGGDDEPDTDEHTGEHYADGCVVVFGELLADIERSQRFDDAIAHQEDDEPEEGEDACGGDLRSDLDEVQYLPPLTMMNR
jgi:hypothetical protein